MPQTPAPAPSAKPTAKKPTPKSLIFTKHVDTIKVGAKQQRSLTLGTYSTAQPAKGFFVGLSPSPRKSDVVTSRIILTQNNPEEYELTLHIANHSGRLVGAQIWQM